MYIADLHIHSRYSRATSKECTPEHLDLWARRKGIGIVGTGDFTHPAWRQELTEKLEPAEEGLYVLKEEYRIREPRDQGAAMEGSDAPRFVITGEISSIYKKNGRVRKVHSVLILPGLEDAARISAKLEQIGNIHSDGRPILGLDCHDLLEIVLELCPEAVYVPAHIWTPHFSLFGAFSGFDTAEECFGDLTPYIHAVETGLSSDPPMNWRVSALDRFQLISNSDAHSPAKLGREANLLDIPLSYEGLARAVQTGEGLCGTIEFFPEEGKYHMDGHRKCSLCLSPSETMKYGGICPVCGRKITIGVSHRIEELADREEGYLKPDAKAYESLVPLPEVLGASLGCSASSKKVLREYWHMLDRLGSEFRILREIPIPEIRRAAGTRTAEGIARLRRGEVERIPGFDGEYGVIRLFRADELENTEGQMDFFDMLGVDPGAETTRRENAAARQKTEQEPGKDLPAARQKAEQEPGKDLPAARQKAEQEPGKDLSAARQKPGRQTGKEGAEVRASRSAADPAAGGASGARLNAEQETAVTSLEPRIAVLAGPGTGKTKTLVSRLGYLLENRRVHPSEITAVTFTNQAASEMRVRTGKETGRRQAAGRIQIGTFHAICLDFLKRQGVRVSLAGEAELKGLAADVLAGTDCGMSVRDFLENVSREKSGCGGRKGTGAQSDDSENADPGKRANFAEESADPGKKANPAEKSAGQGKEAESWRRAYSLYEEEKRKRGLYDFDDLLLRTAEMIETGSAARGWEKRFRYLLVDEFQDINPLQQRLIRLWHKAGRELFVIGDPNQSIYGFRGADADCFDRLRGEYPDLCEITLRENYRSTPQILSAAERIISGGTGGEAGTHLRANCPSGAPVRAVQYAGLKSQAVFIAKEIGRLAGGIGMLEAHETAWARDGQKVRGFGDIAVLCRTHRQAELLESCFRREGIPCVVAGREDYLSADKVQGTIGFLKYLADPADTAGMASCAELLWGLEWNPLTEEAVRSLGGRYRAAYQKKKPEEFMKLWMEEQKADADEAMQKLLQTSLFYKAMPDFLNALLLGVESDLKRCGGKRYLSEAVTLMTLHGSKGLEFPVVFICGADRGMIPFESEKHPADRDEERRLFYVGVTRAKEELIITTGEEPSEFLEELRAGRATGEGLTEGFVWERAGEKKHGKENFHQMSLFE